MIAVKYLVCSTQSPTSPESPRKTDRGSKNFGLFPRIKVAAILALWLAGFVAQAQSSWQDEFAKMPLVRPVAELTQSNCVQVMLDSFKKNSAVKGLIFMPGATDEFYFFHRARASISNAAPSLLDAVCALTNQTYIRATLRPPFLVMHTEEDPLEPIEVIEDARTAERIKGRHFEKSAVFYDRHWDHLHPLLTFYLGTKIRPGVRTHETNHFFRHSFAEFNLTGWEILEAVAMAGKTKFTVKKNLVVFEGDTRMMAPTPVPDDFLMHRR